MMKRELRLLYKQIPPVPCKEGCTDCCGPVPWMPQELARIEGKIPLGTERIALGNAVILNKPGNTQCPFAEDGRCLVYSIRPYICRLFGAVKEPSLICPHGCKAKNCISQEKARAMTATYQAIANTA